MDNNELEKLENEKKSGWGGKRDNSGRKPLLANEELQRVKELISCHGGEIDEIEGKERTLVLMDQLYSLGKKGNVIAIKEYLDRQIGKAKESIDHTTDGEKIEVITIGYGRKED